MLLARAPGRRSLLPAIGAAGLLGACLLPLALAQESAGYASFIAAEPLGERIAKVGKQILLGYDSPIEAVSAGLAMAVAAGRGGPGGWRAPIPATAGASRPRGRSARPAWCCPCWQRSRRTDYLLTRNVILAWVPLAILVAAGLTAMRAGRAGPGGARAARDPACW